MCTVGLIWFRYLWFYSVFDESRECDVTGRKIVSADVQYYVCVLTDVSYADPLGPQIERPRTAARRRPDQQSAVSDEFSNEQIGDDLLPD